MFFVLLTDIVRASSHTKCVSFSNQKCIIQPILTNFHLKEYGKKLRYYPLVVKLDRGVGICNTLNDLCNKVCAPNKTEDLNLSVFSMIKGINQSKILTKHLSCECKCKFDGRKCNSSQWWNNDKCRCECKICHRSGSRDFEKGIKNEEKLADEEKFRFHLV